MSAIVLATEAALSLATLTYNLTVLFQRHLGWQQKVTIASLRFWLFVTPGIIAHPAGETTIKLAVPPRERDWWSRLWEKILSRFPTPSAPSAPPKPFGTTLRLPPEPAPIYFHLLSEISEFPRRASIGSRSNPGSPSRATQPFFRS